MTDFETGSPNVRQVQDIIRNKQDVELKLMTDDLLVGKIRWQDTDCICLVDQYDQPTIVWRHGIVYLKPKP